MGGSFGQFFDAGKLLLLYENAKLYLGTTKVFGCSDNAERARGVYSAESLDHQYSCLFLDEVGNTRQRGGQKLEERSSFVFDLGYYYMKHKHVPKKRKVWKKGRVHVSWQRVQRAHLLRAQLQLLILFSYSWSASGAEPSPSRQDPHSTRAGPPKSSTRRSTSPDCRPKVPILST